jgi:indolepyruvate ferredoxin oxidoreductase beta subunit
MKHFNIITCGVGGTGVIGLGKLLREAAMQDGARVLSAESRGSGQRGGPAVACVRFTLFDHDETYSDRTALWTGSVGIGGADLMIATEASEALRNAHYLSEDSRVLLNTFSLKPAQTREEIKTKSIKYPSIEEILSNLKQLTSHIYMAQASEISLKNFGSYVTTNPLLMGMALAWGLLPLKKETIRNLLKGKAEEAFELGLGTQSPL